MLWDQVVQHCSASTGFAVCFCPPGSYGTGLGQDGCDKTAWTVAVPVSLSWPTSQDIARRFTARPTWVADEILLWQILLGKDTADATGSNVPHYWMSSMKVSVLEAAPGRHVATLYPLFQDDAMAQAAHGRLLSYLAANGNDIMSGTALVHAIEVRAWDAEERPCPVGLDTCEAASFPSCLDAANVSQCLCQDGRLPKHVECAEVRECTLSHEVCHINEVCTLTCDVDECSTGAHTCDSGFEGANQICIDTLGSFQCVCAVGFVKSGSNCTDVDECAGERKKPTP